MMMYYSKLAG